MFERILDLEKLLKKKSFFLFGPRATGKSFLIERQLSNKALIINLLKSDIYLMLSQNPEKIEDMINASDKKIIVIDEIQRIPELLNEVHFLIESKKLTFLLTGSSARKLRTGSVNLLAGRAWKASFFPLVSPEIDKFNLKKYLKIGGLPVVYESKEPEEELDAYVETYLKEEIYAESLIRKIPPFARFLKVSSLTNGNIINFSKISSDCMVPMSTVKSYYQILEDTLIGFMLPAWTKSVKRKALTSSKFYYFDIGVKNYLAGIKNIEKNTDIFGQNFEHFIILEVKAYLDYFRIKKNIRFWRSKNNQEVDLLIGDEIAIEIKSSDNAKDRYLNGLQTLKEENIFKSFYLISFDKIERETDGIKFIYWENFLKKLWDQKII